MTRYIDADNILYKDLSEGRGACWVTFKDWIDEMPTADVVEVVRCKDCKYWQDQAEGIVEVPICTREDCYVVIMGENDFCSRGKRADT